ncbi:MAG: hypothetical protein DHS20C17_07520 [Cyclobacteriaceae bacterium]|nr:MAG: hypothetical protein DHS20C17_07520 [Cyclobacteriaceae bacterium]
MLLGLGWIGLKGQTSNIELSGKVIDADSLTPIPSVFIYTASEEGGAITNENGFFSINFNATDTLVFSAVNYQSTFYILPDSLRQGRPYIEVAMEIRTIKLKPLVVKGHLNPAAVRRYLDNVNNRKREENQPNIYRNKPHSEPITTPAGRKHTVSLGTSTRPEGGAALEGALTGLANLFNKRAQQQKRIAALLEAKQNREAQKAYQDFISTKFNQQVVAEATGLNGQQLDDFLQYCNLSNEFIYYATEYELLEAIFARYYRFMGY